MGEKIQTPVETKKDTIVARATAPGIGAIGIVRVSGTEAFSVLANIVRKKEKLNALKDKQMQLVDILDKDGVIVDQAMVVKFSEPHSYTGENVVEIFLHGSPFIISQVIDLCCRVGARLAEPGEFTLRAFLNGRLDLTQAEAVSDLISASGKASHRAALLQKQGNLSERIHQIRDRIISVLGLIELDIDFTDQELPLLDNTKIMGDLEDIFELLEDLLKSYQRGRLAMEGAVIVIGGPPNVGKSTLFNALIGEDKAITHDVPGTTRDAVEAMVEWGGWTVRLVDSAGIDEEYSGVDQQAVDRSKRLTETADLVLWVVDAVDAEKAEKPSWITAKCMIVINKVDLVDESILSTFDFIAVSALKRLGLDRIKDDVISDIFEDNRIIESTALLTKERHHKAVEAAIGFIVNAKFIFQEGSGIELAAFELNEAVHKLQEITGEITNDDILQDIFSRFCLGK
ncbi:tRNA uridine-5-carboxymethylaminomethyl(34) synthesis GTPase MnmE [bacterium]|nr:tRNA uridine-5-carboxymethylaminomethyl(34) synthesis GTPase MnmE [bacterium]MBU1651975.1 tRNA uridine-5-carboxymethylaminomethyl(34) synthesis GTPase MnmE [bacterium]MBU1882165.1 tRNA uridine-5-carboxymethylaminomethyl(34) synthesis GTPase MnmE [bacterium]